MMRFKYLMMAAACALFASCMNDGYTEPDENAPAPYGNNELTETNVITIAQLKNNFATYIATDFRDGRSFAKVDDDIKIKAIVTSSDVQGNVYQELALQDATGAIIVSVAQGGLYGALPVGTEVLVSLKDLYVGNYGKQAQIGVPSLDESVVQHGISTIRFFQQDIKLSLPSLQQVQLLQLGISIQTEVSSV